MNPWFTIIVPVYNVESYIHRCMKSLLGQSFTNLEIILIDDGSDDSSGKICDEYAKIYNFVKVIHKINGGLASARNEGLKYARGQYVGFVDSDDWIDLSTYKIAYDILNKEDIDILNFGYSKIVNEKVTVCEHAIFQEGIYNREEIKQVLLPDSIAKYRAFEQANLPTQLSACMCIYRRRFLEQNKLQFESERVILSEDWLFNISCMCKANQIAVNHQYLYYYNTRDTSLSMTYKTDSYERKKSLFRRYLEVLEETGNMNEITRHRLNNFWLEAIYGCFSIELSTNEWDKQRKNKLYQLSKDEHFCRIASTMHRSKCTLKGYIFLVLVKYNQFSVIRMIYRIRKSGLLEESQ